MGGDKVAFSLTTSKKKRKTTATSSVVASEFDSSENAEKQKKRNAANPTLVIPLPKNDALTRGGPLLARTKVVSSATSTKDSSGDTSTKGNNNDDKTAQQALVDEATRHFANKDAPDGSTTDFEASGKLVISSKSDTFEGAHDTETDKFRQDVEILPEDVPVDSDVYDNVRIADFGAAMLRGMGWKGNDNTANDKKKKDDTAMPRPHRLGLGATPKMPKVNKNKMRRPDQIKRDEMLERQHLEYKAKQQEQMRLDKQVTMQIGSIVECNSRRAKMIQLQGVPGLNQVKVQYEDKSEHVSVKRSSVALIDREELNKRPFQQAKEGRDRPPDRDATKEESSRHRDSRSRDKDSQRQYDDRDRRDRDSSRRRREDDSDRRRGRDNDRDRKSDDRRSKRRSRSRERDASSRDRKKRRREEPRDYRDEPKKTSSSSTNNDQVRPWLIPNIRVRIVSKKFGSRHYKQKGIVLDVMPGGGAATLEMENGQVLEQVSERHLETALPKAGGNAIVLVGKNRFAKGKLLERDRNNGIIQVFEDMSVLTLALDDVAQWCGPLDDDLG